MQQGCRVDINRQPCFFKTITGAFVHLTSVAHFAHLIFAQLTSEVEWGGRSGKRAIDLRGGMGWWHEKR